METELKLIKYRDSGLPTYTYFWVNEDDKVVGTYFDSEEDAKKWLEERLLPEKS